MKALVTGASTGIGKALAIELSKKGYEVGLVARNKEKLEKVREEILLNGGKAEVFATDLSNLQDVSKLIAEVKNKFGSLDILANIAAVWHGESEHYFEKNIDEYEEKLMIDIFNVGLISPILLSRGLFRLMPKKSSILNISGTFWRGGKGCVPLFVSKRAMEDFTLALSDELRPREIKVNCISPSDTASEALSKFFPEELESGNSLEKIVGEMINLIEGNETGKVKVVREGKLEIDGYHK